MRCQIFQWVIFESMLSPLVGFFSWHGAFEDNCIVIFLKSIEAFRIFPGDCSIAPSLHFSIFAQKHCHWDEHFADIHPSIDCLLASSICLRFRNLLFAHSFLPDESILSHSCFFSFADLFLVSHCWLVSPFFVAKKLHFLLCIRVLRGFRRQLGLFFVHSCCFRAFLCICRFFVPFAGQFAHGHEMH